MATSLDRVFDEMDITWEALGCEAPVVYPDEDGTGDCIVCGGSTEGSRWCGSGCYQLWKNTDEDLPARFIF